MKYLGRKDKKEGCHFARGLHWGKSIVFAPDISDEYYVCLLLELPYKCVRVDITADSQTMQSLHFIAFFAWSPGSHKRREFRTFWHRKLD